MMEEPAEEPERDVYRLVMRVLKVPQLPPRWQIAFPRRSNNQDPITYLSEEMFFSIHLHHGGYFASLPWKAYIGDIVDFFDFYNMEKMGFLELDVMVREVGVEGKYVNYFWQNSNEDENESTVKELVTEELKTDADFNKMLNTCLALTMIVHIYVVDVSKEEMIKYEREFHKQYDYKGNIFGKKKNERKQRVIVELTEDGREATEESISSNTVLFLEFYTLNKEVGESNEVNRSFELGGVNVEEDVAVVINDDGCEKNKGIDDVNGLGPHEETVITEEDSGWIDWLNVDTQEGVCPLGESSAVDDIFKSSRPQQDNIETEGPEQDMVQINSRRAQNPEVGVSKGDEGEGRAGLDEDADDFETPLSKYYENKSKGVSVQEESDTSEDASTEFSRKFKKIKDEAFKKSAERRRKRWSHIMRSEGEESSFDTQRIDVRRSHSTGP